MGVTKILNHMREVPTLLKVLTNSKVHKFDELASLICLTNCDNACTTGVERVVSGIPMKLTPEQCLLNFIMYLKHDHVIKYESFNGMLHGRLCPTM